MADDPGPLPDAVTRFAPEALLAGRFRIVREIASGGMGVVYEAYDEKLARRIALKAARAGLARLLSPEVRNASTVSHPNICRIYELHSTATAAGEVDFITMEFVEGESLAARLARGPLPEPEAKTIALQICAGLAEAHRSGIVHGDLKPQNVVLGTDAQGRVRAVIMDFGLARQVEGEGLSGGTRGYMAPELGHGAPLTVASDVYALGVILHELASGQHPEARAVELASTVAVSPGGIPGGSAAGERSTMPRLLGSRWDPIIRRCLEPDPAARYRDVSELVRALDPPRVRTRVWAMALGVIAVTLGIAYWEVNAPATTVKLAVESPVSLERALGSVRGTRAVGFRMVKDPTAATHRLLVTDRANDSTHQVLVELRETGTSTTLRFWGGRFTRDEWPQAPVAIAAMVSATLHLAPDPRLTLFRDPAARRDYDAALPMLRDDARLDSALAALQRAADREPHSPLPWAALAEARWRKYYLTDAKEWLEGCRDAVAHAERRGQDTPEVHRIAGLLEANEGRFAQAIARYTRATELPSTNADAWRRLGEAYRLQNQPERALAALQRATLVEPGYARTHQDLGSWYFARGNYAASVPELAEAVRLAPTATRPRSVLASAYMNLGRFTDAERTLREGLAQGEDAALLLPLAQTLMYQSREREAIPLLTRAEVLDPSQMLTPLYLGNCLLVAGRWSEAQVAYERALLLAQSVVMRSPQLGYYRGFLAYLCARTGERDRAVVEIEQALRSSPDAADVRWAAALTYETLRMRDRAIEVLRSAPRDQLEDLSRWPEAGPLVQDDRFQQLLQAAPRTP